MRGETYVHAGGTAGRSAGSGRRTSDLGLREHASVATRRHHPEKKGSCYEKKIMRLEFSKKLSPGLQAASLT